MQKVYSSYVAQAGHDLLETTAALDYASKLCISDWQMKRCTLTALADQSTLVKMHPAENATRYSAHRLAV